MNKNMIIAGTSALALIIVVILVLSFTPKNPETDDENGIKPADNIESIILHGIEKYIAGDKSIVKILVKSEKHRKKFIEILQSEPAFTLALGRILAETREFDELILSFASNFASPELYPVLVDYLKLKTIDEDKRQLAHRILVSGDAVALNVIFNKHYDKATGRISDVDEIRMYLQYFPHYYQLKFWLEKYTSNNKNDLLSKTAKTNFNSTAWIYSPASIKAQLKLFSDIDNLKQQEVIMWAIAQNRIRPQWYEWFVPMFAKAVSEKNNPDTPYLFNSLVEVIVLPRRDMLVTLLENWLRKNVSNTTGYKILSGAVQQGRTQMERYRSSNSLYTNEPTDEPDSPDPDENLLSVLPIQKSSAEYEIFEKLTKIYSDSIAVDVNSSKNMINAYNFENFAVIQKNYFVKPFLFEIAQNSGIKLGEGTWRSSFFSAIYDKKTDLSKENMSNEQNLWLKFVNVLGAIWGLNEIDTNSNADLFKTTKMLESVDSQIAKFTHLAILELLTLPDNKENLELFIKNLENTELTDNQKFSLSQIIAVHLDKLYKAQYLSEFNPFQSCIDMRLFNGYSEVLSAIKIKKHRFSVELLKSILEDHKEDEKLVLVVFQKIKSIDLQGLDAEIAQFLLSDNAVLIAKTLMMLPFNAKYSAEFERFMIHMDSEVRTAAALRMLESGADQKVLNAISVLKQEQPLELGKNLWRIKNAEIIEPILLEISQNNLEIFTNIIKRRSDLMLLESIFDEGLEIFKHTEDSEIQADVLKAMLTREDKVAELLITAGKNKEYKIRHIAWDYAINNPKELNAKLILALLNADYYKETQHVLMYISENPKWIREHADVKNRVMKFLEKTKEGLQFSAVFALVSLENDAEVASAFCKAINKRVLWPVSVQVWTYIKSFTHLDVAEAMLDIITHEERNATDFASSYLVEVLDDFKGLREKIYKTFEGLEFYKNVLDFLPIFTATHDKAAAKLLFKKDYTKLKEGVFRSNDTLPKEVARALSLIFELEADPRNMIKKAYWTKYIK